MRWWILASISWIVDSDEGCDDAGPSADCSAECIPTSCGDGTVDEY